MTNIKTTPIAWDLTDVEFIGDEIKLTGLVIKSLKGAPKKCKAFVCRRLNSIKNLRYAPEIVDVEFRVIGCTSLETLDGAPKKVGVIFDCSGCRGLKDLKGAPEIVGSFSCGFCPNIGSLDGSPKKVGGDFICCYNIGMMSLNGAPEIVDGKFDCRFNTNLESLEGAPKKCKVFVCKGCSKLKNLDPLLRCEIEEVEADEHLLKDYLRKKAAIQKHGYDKAMEIIDMLNDLI